MKKLIVHAGTHKTATTSFQQVCFDNREQLTKSGISYPLLSFYPNDPIFCQTLNRSAGKPELIAQHSYLARWISKGNLSDVSTFLENALKSANLHSCDTTLISGEDFESSLVDTSIAIKFKNVALQIGFDEVIFNITKRPVKDYFRSLYNQLATQAIPCNPVTLYETISSHGYASFSSMHGIFHYAFDLFRLAAEFERETHINCRIQDYEDFLEVYPGHTLLKSLSASGSEEQIKNLNTVNSQLNSSRDKGNIEFLHACAYLSLKPNTQTFENNADFFRAIIQRREEVFLHAIKLVEDNLKRFDQNQNRL